MYTAHDKALREQKEAHDLAATNASKENELLSNKVKELEDKLSTQAVSREAEITEAKNLGARNFMKIFTTKVPEFDWNLLGASTARHAIKLRAELERESQEAHLKATENACIVADQARRAQLAEERVKKN